MAGLIKPQTQYAFIHFPFQKARLARIQIAKATSGAAFVSKKKAAEAKMAARAANGNEGGDTKEDIFEMQHHHLLRCLEKTTVSIISKCCKDHNFE